MPKMTIKDADGRLNGDYDVTMPPWTKREWFLVKKQCDVIASDFSANEDGSVDLDMNLLTAIGIVALHRAGRDQLIPLFWETTDDQVVYDFSDLEEEQRQEAAKLPPASTNSEPESRPESSVSSGNGSSSAGASSADPLSPTGRPSLVASSASDRATSET